jgi:maltose alpha-D-glucosyltransferase/alpha-amylase
MGDAFADETFCRAVVSAMAKRRDIATAHGKLQFRPTAAFAQLAGSDFAALPVARPQGSSSNTIVVMGERLILKGYRRLRAGASPELEMGLFLTEVVKYPNCAPLAGVLDYVGNDGQSRLLAMLQAYVANQGDGWTYSLDYLRRHLEEHRTTPSTDAIPTNAHEAYLIMVRTLAKRTAELHVALATVTGDAAFDPQPLARADFDAYRQRATGEARSALALLKTNIDQVPAADRDKANDVLARQEQILARLDATVAEEAEGMKIRIHGDYHLGQVLVTRNDFVIVDFEGEPGNSIEQRRAKQSPLRDVAGMLRSFSYVEHSALRSVAHDEVEFAKLAPLARGWAAEARDAFVTAYDAEARRARMYSSLKPGHGLLGLFEIEKALYELRYELSNRPTWAGIPLQGIIEWGAK